MAQQPHIPKTVSQPEGPGPSFLTLAPELRNTIYEHLVILPHPIRISRLDNTRSLLGASSKQPYRSGAASVLGILGTCHTTYHEAVGIFYAQNTFVYDFFDTNYRMSILAPFVAHFVEIWWSRFHYLHHVTIQCGDFPDFSDSSDFDLAPLVKICWARDDQKCIFSLISPVDAEQDEQPEESTVLMNETLRQLVADTFGIRQYHRQILSIGMDHFSNRVELPSRICVRFGSNTLPYQFDATWELKFQSKDQFKISERYDKYQKPNLICLPRRIKESIFEEVMCSCPIDVNVLGKNPISPDISLLFVNREISDIARPIFWSRNIFTYRMTQGPMPVDKTSQDRLEAALCTNQIAYYIFPTRRWPYNSRHIYDNQHQSITIEFNFHYDRAMALADIRIDAKHLIRITSPLDGRKCFVRFKVSSTVDGVTKIEQSTITLRYIRDRILELLSQAISTNRRIADSSSFDFDIDGNGEDGRLEYIVESNAKSVYGSNSYNQLPSIEDVEAQFGIFNRQGYRSRLFVYPPPCFTGELITYLIYLQAVVDPSPGKQQFSDDYFAKKCFFTRFW